MTNQPILTALPILGTAAAAAAVTISGYPADFTSFLQGAGNESAEQNEIATIAVPPLHAPGLVTEESDAFAPLETATIIVLARRPQGGASGNSSSEPIEGSNISAADTGPETVPPRPELPTAAPAGAEPSEKSGNSSTASNDQPEVKKDSGQNEPQAVGIDLTPVVIAQPDGPHESTKALPPKDKVISHTGTPDSAEPQGPAAAAVTALPAREGVPLVALQTVENALDTAIPAPEKYADFGKNPVAEPELPDRALPLIQPRIDEMRPVIASDGVAISTQPGRFGDELAVAIARHAERGADAGSETLTLRLDPPAHGRIEVRLQFDEGAPLRANIIASNASTLDILRRESGELFRALGQAGIGADAQSFQFGGNAHQHAPHKQPPTMPHAPEGLAAETADEQALLHPQPGPRDYRPLHNAINLIT